MSIEEITAYVESLGGVLVMKPQPGDGSPEIAWGDRFFYYAPDGVVPKTQPFATIVTKDYPGEPSSGLDRPGAFRVNVAAGVEHFAKWAGREPREPAIDDPAPTTVDTVMPHPVYGTLGWLCVVDPGPASTTALQELLGTAHALASARSERRAGDASA